MPVPVGVGRPKLRLPGSGRSFEDERLRQWRQRQDRFDQQERVLSLQDRGFERNVMGRSEQGLRWQAEQGLRGETGGFRLDAAFFQTGRRFGGMAMNPARLPLSHFHAGGRQV